MRIILFTGKGGVGKTTIASATALRTAELGYKTLAVSTDASHSLGDAFDMEMGNAPVKVADNLWGQQVDVLDQIDANWRVIQDYISSVIKSRGIDHIIADELAVLPGMDELFGLLEIHRARQKGSYDCIIVDCAPTGQTLRLLSFPDVARWWMEKIFPVERKVAKVIRPMTKTILSIPIPEDLVFASAQKLFNDTEKLKALLTEPQTTSVRLVLNPEKIVVDETQRAYTYLNLFGYAVDCVIANRILPDAVVDSYFKNWHKTQHKYLEKITASFSPLPILHSELMRSEIVGAAALLRLAKSIYGKDDPTRIYYEGTPQTITRQGRDYVLHLRLPFARKADLEVFKNEEQLIIRVGSYRRDLFLPGALALLTIKKASFEAGELRIIFAKGDSDGKNAR